MAQFLFDQIEFSTAPTRKLRFRRANVYYQAIMFGDTASLLLVDAIGLWRRLLSDYLPGFCDVIGMHRLLLFLKSSQLFLRDTSSTTVAVSSTFVV